MYLEKAQKDTVVLKSEKSAILGSHELFATKAFFEIFFRNRQLYRGQQLVKKISKNIAEVVILQIHTTHSSYICYTALFFQF